MKHGLSGYHNHKCRCAICTAGQRDYHRTLKGRPAPSHGVSGYRNYGCRCDLCRAAHSTKRKAERQAERSRGAS